MAPGRYYLPSTTCPGGRVSPQVPLSIFITTSPGADNVMGGVGLVKTPEKPLSAKKLAGFRCQIWLKDFYFLHQIKHIYLSTKLLKSSSGELQNLWPAANRTEGKKRM